MGNRIHRPLVDMGESVFDLMDQRPEDLNVAVGLTCLFAWLFEKGWSRSFWLIADRGANRQQRRHLASAMRRAARKRKRGQAA